MKLFFEVGFAISVILCIVFASLWILERENSERLAWVAEAECQALNNVINTTNQCFNVLERYSGEEFSDLWPVSCGWK